MSFSQGVEYNLELNLHSKLMLAFRYGIAIEEECVSAFFEGYFKSSNTKDSTGRVKCKFNIKGQKVSAVMKNLALITALPMSQIFDTADAKAVAVGFDFALTIDPDLFTMQEIADWRDQYLHSNGGITKDDLRREIKKRAPNQRDPMEILGLHDTFFEEVKELREIVQDKVNWDTVSGIDFGLPREDFNKVLEENDRLNNLAKTDRTVFWEETPEYFEEMRKDYDDWINSDEYKRQRQEDYEHDQRQLRREILEDGEDNQKRWNHYIQSPEFQGLDEIAKASKKKQFNKHREKHHPFWLKVQETTKNRNQEWSNFKKSDEYLSLSDDEKQDRENEYKKILKDFNPFALVDKRDSDEAPEEKIVKAEPVIGIPIGGDRLTSYNNKPVYYHENCVVTGVWINPRHDGWHEIHYENEKERFITTTKHAFIADTYKAGQRGVWTISYNNNRVNYIQPFGGSPEEAGDFYHSLEYLEKRYLAIKRSEGKCEACESRESIQVDHIKPRSLYPKLELELSNLQVLCQKCNLGKGNTDTTDFRK
jgi:5-methylcytosine-specific restriction endonuclease McrA